MLWSKPSFKRQTPMMKEVGNQAIELKKVADPVQDSIKPATCEHC
jgi:hypothetical protein